MNEKPLVTINILSFNRKDELHNTITKVFEQDYKNIEVIVVDNASSDGSPEMVEKEFPKVQLIRLEKNIGIAGWNEGFNVAKGEYVLVLDDDAYPGKESLNLAVQKIKSNNKIGCIAFNVINTNPQNFNFRSNWLPAQSIKESEWPIFVGCAVLFKKSIEVKMPEDYFLYQHELPVSADIYIRNHKIIYDKGILAYHNFKNDKNYHIYNDTLCFKNNLMFINKYLPFYLTIPYTLQLIIFYLSRSIRKGWFNKYLRIIFQIPYRPSGRSMIPYSYFKQLRKLHIFNLSIISKLVKI